MTTQDPIEVLKQMGISFIPQNFCYNASTANNITAVELFLKAGMNVNTQFNNAPALYWACANGNEEIVNLLIANGANVNAVNALEDKYAEKGYTPLMTAIYNKHEGKNISINIIKALLENKADANIKSGEVNAMTLAMKYKYIEIIELLKQYGALEPSKEDIEKVKKADVRRFRSGMLKVSAVIVIFIFLGWLCFHGGSSSSSSYSSSSSEKTHTCEWCKKQYTGPGYYHIMDQCAQKDADYDQCCSQKCCMEEWNSTHPH